MINFCMTSISKVLVFLNFVYNPMGVSSTGALSTRSTPNTIFYILTHNFIILNVQVSIFRYKKKRV